MQSPIVISHSFSVTVHYTDRRDQGRDKNSPHELNVIDKNVTISSVSALAIIRKRVVRNMLYESPC